MLNGAVLAAGVDALQHDEERAPPFGVEEILENAEALQVLGELRGGSGLGDAVCVRGVDIVQFDARAGTHQELFGKLFHTGFILH